MFLVFIKKKEIHPCKAISVKVLYTFSFFKNEIMCLHIPRYVVSSIWYIFKTEQNLYLKRTFLLK